MDSNNFQKTKLLPCPFCGIPAERAIQTLRGDIKLYTAGCFNRSCMVSPYTMWQPFQEMADEKWNKRAALSKTVEGNVPYMKSGTDLHAT